MKISDILSLIDSGVIELPEFQRGYVWSREQVRSLMRSLYLGYPVGSLLIWTTKKGATKARVDSGLKSGTVDLLLDGQQRITSLYGIIRGAPPIFFQGSSKSFIDLYFDADNEEFEFFGPVKMRDRPQWFSVTRVMKDGAVACLEEFLSCPDVSPNIAIWLKRLNALERIKDRDFHIETTGDRTIHEIVGIFEVVNSVGTRLSRGDLALANICVESPEARVEMRNHLAFWKSNGFNFSLDWLLRCVTASVTGRAEFHFLETRDSEDFRKALADTVKAINTVLNLLSGRLGLDHDRVMTGRYAIPVMCRRIALHGGRLDDKFDQDRLLFWFIHAFIWGRYASAAETTLNQDLSALEDSRGDFETLIRNLHKTRGDLTVKPDDFCGYGTGARFYPMLYLLTRVLSARDWQHGLPLRSNMLGKQSSLHVHHIFPKVELYKAGFKREDVNAVANFCLQTADANWGISNKKPEAYFPRIEESHQGALTSQWIPMDPALWTLSSI